MTVTLVYLVPVHAVIDERAEVILSVSVAEHPVATEVSHTLDSGGNVLDPHVDRDRIESAVQIASGLDWPQWTSP